MNYNFIHYITVFIDKLKNFDGLYTLNTLKNL